VHSILNANRKYNVVASVFAAPDMRRKHEPANKFLIQFQKAIVDFIESFNFAFHIIVCNMLHANRRYLPSGINGASFIKNCYLS
jgi:hypothetical protein